MNCNIARPLIDPLADDELATETAAQVIGHISTCTDCQDIWQSAIILKERLHALAGRTSIPDGALERLDRRIVSETGVASLAIRNLSSRLVLVAAVIITSLAGFVFMYRSPAVIEARQLAGDVLDDYSSGGDLDIRLGRLSSAVGFSVVAPEISGWRLVGADLYKNAGTRICMARLTYQELGRVSARRISLYQTCAGRVDARGLRQMTVAGRKICCGEVAGVSVVYLPGEKTDSVMVGAIPEKALMKLALEV